MATAPSIAAAAAAERQRRLALARPAQREISVDRSHLGRGLLDHRDLRRRRERRISRELLFAGDWDFWTDWKDPQWWPVVTAFATIIIPSALQYIQWAAWRFPTGATYTCVCLFMASWIGRYFQWHVAEGYPMNFVWPISTIPAAIILDWLLMRTKSFVLTSLFGGGIWAVMVWSFNYIPLAPFLQPMQFMHHILTVADVQGIVYIRTQTPEYMRHIERGALRSFLGETQYVSLVFGGTLAMLGYWIGQFIGRLSRRVADWQIHQDRLNEAASKSNANHFSLRVPS